MRAATHGGAISTPHIRSGQTVYLTCGAWVEPVTFIRNLGGRCLIACGSGGITVSRNRLFLTEEEAKKHLPATSVKRIRELAQQRRQGSSIQDMHESCEAEYVSEKKERCQSWRYNSIDTPGDGWAGR